MKVQLIGLLMCLLAFPLLASNPVWLEGKTDDRHEITVYRSATCGCCKGWIKHLEEHNFAVKDVTVDDVNTFKQQFKVPAEAASCPTAMVDGVVIKGLVPAQDIKRLLADKRDVRLLAGPAMPSGSPGMDFDGATKDAFRVYSVSKDDRVDVFQTYSDY